MIIAERKKKSNDMILDVHSFHSKELITILKVNGFNFFVSLNGSSETKVQCYVRLLVKSCYNVYASHFAQCN